MMHHNTFIRHAGRLTAGVALIAVAAIGVRTTPAHADSACGAARPCITKLNVVGNTNSNYLATAWTGGWDSYNIRWENPGQVFANEVDGAQKQHTLMNPAWGRTYTFKVQGCTHHFLAPSTCSAWSSQSITLRAPTAPTNVRVIDGSRIEWASSDPLALNFRVQGDIATGISSAPQLPASARSSALTGLNAVSTSVRVCAINPAGTTCSAYVARSMASPAQPPRPQAPKPATPSGFTATRDGGFGSRIVLRWDDVADETYYWLSAYSDGQIITVPLGNGAPKLGANSTAFIVDSEAKDVVGNVEFHLQACNPTGCSAPAIAPVK